MRLKNNAYAVFMAFLNPLNGPYKFYEGINSGLSIQSLYRPDKEFTGLFLLKSAFLKNIIICHTVTLPVSGND